MRASGRTRGPAAYFGRKIACGESRFASWSGHPTVDVVCGEWEAAAITLGGGGAPPVSPMICRVMAGNAVAADGATLIDHLRYNGISLKELFGASAGLDLTRFRRISLVWTGTAPGDTGCLQAIARAAMAPTRQ